MKFKKIENKIWTGRYTRIEGKTSVFHLKRVDGRYRTTIYWGRGDEHAICVATDSPAERALAEAVADAKQSMGGRGGGSFQINEFRQIIVPPSQGNLKRLLIGEISERWHFKNPFEDGGIIDLSNVDGFTSGNSYPHPYIGMPFNLNRRSQIYFWKENEEGGQSCYPQRQDKKLIRQLRAIRGSGPVRFIVNPWGVVLTKKPIQGTSHCDETMWNPVYVGRIDPLNWFEKEV